MPIYRGTARLKLRRPTSGIDVATAAWVSAVVTAGGTVSGAQQANVDTLVKAYKAANVWTILDRVWLLAAANTQQANIDIVNLATWTTVGTPTFSANVGYSGNSSTGQLNTNFTPSSAGGNYTQNSAHISAYVKVGTIAANQATVGCNAGGIFAYMEPNTAGASFAYDLNGSTFPTATDTGTNGVGQYVLTRTSSSAVAVYKNGNTTPVGSSAGDTSGALPTVPFFVFSINSFGHPSNGTVAAVTIGGALSSAQMAAVALAMNNYQTAIGNNVY